MSGAWTRSYHPAGLPGLGVTNTHSIASWAQPHTAPATNTSGYDLPPTPVAWPRSDSATTDTTKPTASATVFGLA